MRHVHHFEPVVAHRLERRDAFADTAHEYLAAAAGNRTEARRLEQGNNLLQRQFEHLAEMDELARTETVNVDLRELRFEVVQKIQIPLLGQFGMVPALL